MSATNLELAVDALKTKVTELAGLQDATAEQIAMLGVAIEKVGGDVVQPGDLTSPIDALVAKVTELAASPTASAEDMAMLGTALDKIGIPSTIVTVINEGQRILDDLDANATTISAAKIADIQAAVDQATTDVNNLVASAQTAISSAETTSIQNIDDAAGIHLAEITAVNANKTNIDAVAAIEAAVTSVSSNQANINAVAANEANINAVAANNPNITIVAGDTLDIQALGPISTDITTVAGIAPQVTAVAANQADIDTVAAAITNVNAVGTNILNVNSVAANKANIDAAVANQADIDTVAGSISNVNDVALKISDIESVNANSANVTSVAGSITSVNDVAGSLANVNTVSAAIGNINTVAGIEVDISTVAGSSADVSVVAQNISDVGNFADRYQVATGSDPATRADGSALQSGDLLYRSDTDETKIFNGTSYRISVFNIDGAVFGPASTTDNYVPQWNGAGGDSLKEGLAVGTGANRLLQLDGSGRIPAINGSLLTNLTKSQVGLSNVDNTSDANKPISTAAQAALDGKANSSHTHVIADITGLQTALDDKAASSHTHANATTGAAGFMSAADKTALDAVGTMANRAFTVSTADPSGGADGDIWFKVT